MIFLHTAFVTGSYHANFSPAYSFIVMDVLGRPYAAVVFMFCMGVGVMYSRHSQWDTMVKRGITLFILGIFVNLCEFFIPYFAAGELSVNSHPFNIVGGLMLFCDDILAFAGWAFIFIFKMQEYHNFCKLWMNCTIGCTIFFIYFFAFIFYFVFFGGFFRS